MLSTIIWACLEFTHRSILIAASRGTMLNSVPSQLTSDSKCNPRSFNRLFIGVSQRTGNRFSPLADTRVSFHVFTFFRATRFTDITPRMGPNNRTNGLSTILRP